MIKSTTSKPKLSYFQASIGSFTLFMVGLALSGCGSSPTTLASKSSSQAGMMAQPRTLSDNFDKSTPTGFLKWSMDQYHAMKTFQASDTYSVTSPKSPGMGGTGFNNSRIIEFQAPNHFFITSKGSAFSMTSVSDGKTMREYSSIQGQPAMTYGAPASIATASGGMIQHPMFCGSLLYQFFSGPSNYSQLVDKSQKKVSFGKQEKASNGEMSRWVDFYNSGDYGNVETLIGEKTGFVYEIKYDFAGLLAKMKKMSPGLSSMMGQRKEAIMGTEIYSDIQSGAPIPSSDFSTKVPKGMQTLDLSSLSQQGDKPPVPIGQSAPDFTVSGLDGKSVSLSSLKGHVVLVDFWATWCGPCRLGLPDTARFAKEGASKGLVTLAISSESPATIRSFLAKQAYRLPAYVDEGNKADGLYKVNAIPTVMVIGKNGTLDGYFVGLQKPGTIKKALAKAGMSLQ